jgi:hypothetical protein
MLILGINWVTSAVLSAPNDQYLGKPVPRTNGHISVIGFQGGKLKNP